MTDPDKPTKCKFGITKDPKQRILAYKTANPRCHFSSIWEFPDRSHEKPILRLLKDASIIVESEYVNAPPKLVANIVDGYIEDNLT